MELVENVKAPCVVAIIVKVVILINCFGIINRVIINSL